MYMLSIQIDTKSFELFNNIKLSNFASDMKRNFLCILKLQVLNWSNLSSIFGIVFMATLGQQFLGS